jgi:hypothetical protein
MVVLATPALAAKVYLKDGGFIQAKRVWRAGGKVHVLATRHTLTTFEPSEVNLKRTFARRHRAVNRVAAVQPQPQTTAAAPVEAAASQKPVEKKPGVTINPLPKLPEKSPESLMPSGGGGAAIKKHKKEMSEKVGE